MKCPFREDNGEYKECYGAECMAYYEVPTYGCATTGGDSKPTAPRCVKLQVNQFNPNFSVNLVHTASTPKVW